MRQAAATFTVVAAVLSGCANPILRIEAPGYSVDASKAPIHEPESMGEAIQKLNHLRAKYYEAILYQTGQTQDATTGLVWLGTAIAGMALGNVHRDVVVGASLIGGTTYGLSRAQLDARRILVWTEGIKALDCAKEASLPLDIGTARREQLELARAALAESRTRVKSARDKVQTEVDNLATTPSDLTRRGQEAVSKTDAALAEADKTQAAALDLLQASRGGELSVTVDRIHTKVTEVMGSILVDISSVKQMVAGLGGFASIFAPGAGIESTLGGAFTNYAKASPVLGAQADVAAALNNAMSMLKREMDMLLAAQARVSGLLSEVNLPAISAALKKCDVTGVATLMLLAPSTLNFDEKGAATKGFAISGGTPPYVVTMLDAAPDGLSLLFSGGFADTAQVKSTASVPAGEYRMLVADSGTVKRSQQLVVQVAPKSVGAAPAGGGSASTPATDLPIATPTATGAQKAWDALIAAMKKPGFTKVLKGVKFSVESATLAGSRLQVKLKCDKPDAGLPVKDVRELLATANKVAVKQLKDLNALDGDFTQIDLTSSGSCVKG